ncbi:MAG: TIGR04283 family arsenosugar biosynthesis glycosyltransferase [Mariprofundaceae bacterium]
MQAKDFSKPPTVAIVVPILNEAGKLPELIAMLESLGADEVVFVDGGSSDGSLEILGESDVLWINSESGRAKQMNAGAVKISSDIILFLHADTKLLENNILNIQGCCVDASACAGRFDVRLSGQQSVFRVIEFMINLRSRLSKVSTGDQAMFVRRDVFEKMGGFADIALMEDVELSKRLKKMGKVVCLREKVITSSRRWEKHGIGKTVWLMWKLRLRYFLGADPIKLKKSYVDQN